MAEQQYEELAMEYEKNRILYHDMNHHNLMMWKLAEQGEYERLHEYLEKLRPKENTKHRQWTQNKILDMILEYKLLVMEKKEIQHQIDSDIIGEISISDKELRSVRKTVKSHGGQFEYGQCENNFHVKILISLVI